MIETHRLSTDFQILVAEQLISTKLQIPRLPAKRVTRTTLLRQLDDAMTQKLALISAAAGYGKTTLLASWATQADFPVAWVELHERDNQPEQFWTYVMTALQMLHEGIAGNALAMLGGGSTPIESTLTVAINELALATHQLVLILDNYHLITNPAVHAAMTFFIDHLPPQLHIVIASRTTPPLPLARLRALGHLAELSTADLKFSTAETAELLRLVKSHNAELTDLALLENRTEGWITGLQLGLLSATSKADFAPAALSGSHRHIADYFLEEILVKQSPQIQAFLLQTAVVEKLSADLCDAITAQADSREILAHLERENTFIVALDEARHEYRYHTLFAEFLRARLEACCDQNSIDELHRRATAWYQRTGVNPSALPYATAGDENTRLSQREMEVLRLIATGLSNHEIAAELVVAVSTVKTHVKSIYRKLNVGSRFEAIERVRDLPTPPTRRRPA